MKPVYIFNKIMLYIMVHRLELFVSYGFILRFIYSYMLLLFVIVSIYTNDSYCVEFQVTSTATQVSCKSVTTWKAENSRWPIKRGWI